MYRVLAGLLVMGGLLSGVMQARAADPPAPPAKVTGAQEAALQTNLELKSWDARRRGCAKQLPEHAQIISNLYVHWLDENRAAIHGMLAYAEKSKESSFAFSVIDAGLPDDVESEAKRYNFSPRDFCARLFAGLKAGDFDIARSYADVAQALAAYMEKHPLSVHGARTFDNPMSCMKSALGRDVNFDSAQGMCRCLWNATNSEFTQAEWTGYEAAVSGNKPEAVLELAQFKRVKPKIDACAQSLESK
jgi:hypothetical protein